MRWTAGILIAQLVGCGGGGTSDDAGTRDTGVDEATDCGLPWEEQTWGKVPLPASIGPWLPLGLVDGAPLNAGRGVRVEAWVEMGYCAQDGDLAAMPQVTYAPEIGEVFIVNFAWQPRGEALTCTDSLLVMRRPVTLDLAAGRWSVHLGNPPVHTIVLNVSPAPDRACDTTVSPCQMDCDCPDGQRCVGQQTADGWSTTCATPCAAARDCDGQGICDAQAESRFTCVPGAECDQSNRCRGGYSCIDGACRPDVELGPGTRVPCTCDADCEPPLRCIEPEYPDEVRRCELTCPTAGPWCGTGAYACGQAIDDLDGLAAADSICVRMAD